MDVTSTILTSIRADRNRAMITFMCIVFQVLHVGFYPGCPFVDRLLCHLCHANVFHLAVNLTVLWGIRQRISCLPAFIIAVCATFLPMAVSAPTMGLSGFLFAAFGIMWGRIRLLREACVRVLPFVIFTMLLPGVNGLFHLYTFVLGFIYGYARSHI